MNTWRKVGCCLVAVAGVSFAASAYEDLYISADGDSVVMKETDGRVVYVFSTADAAASVTLKQTLTLEEALVVGGGGAGVNLGAYAGTGEQSLPAKNGLIIIFL